MEDHNSNYSEYMHVNTVFDTSDLTGNITISEEGTKASPKQLPIRSIVQGCYTMTNQMNGPKLFCYHLNIIGAGFTCDK